MGYPNNLTVPDDGDFSRVRTSAQGPEYGLGEMRETVTGKRYRYCKFLDAVTYVANQCLTWANAACTSVTNDISGGSSLGAFAAGVGQAVVAQNGFGWVQTWGPATVKTNGDDDITAGLSLFPSGDGTVDSATAATFVTGRLGYALAADVDADNTVSVFVEVW